MWKTARKNLYAHKLRLALTALAVVLGVAFMAGTFVLTDTIKHDVGGLFKQTTSGYDAVVRATTPYSATPAGGGGGGGISNSRPLTPESLLAIVKSTPGVAAADGSVQGQLSLAQPSGKLIKPKGGAPTLGFAWVPDHELSSLVLRSGRAPTKDGEMVIDAATAKSAHLSVGSPVTVIGNAPPERFTVVGVVGFGKNDTIVGATIVAFDTATTQRLVGKPGYFTQIDVKASSGTSVSLLISAIQTRLPKGYEAVTSATVAQEGANVLDTFINQLNDFILAFALIALFVGAFLIFNTFGILVGQRTRELALLRALGASRRQVTSSVILESFFTGLVGSIIGLVVGVLIAGGLLAALKSVLDLGSTSLQILPRTIIVALVAGTLITVVSALGPSIRASRVPPVAAMRDDATIAESSLRRRAISGTVVLVVGLVVLAAGLFGHGGIGIVGLGAAVTFVGVAMLVPFIASPLARAIGSPLTLTGVTGQLGRENAARNPRRTAATAAALMIGLAVVAAIATLGSSATASFSALFNHSFKADYVIDSGQNSFPTTAESALRSAPGVTLFSPYTEVQWHQGGASKMMAAIDPVTGPKLVDIEMVTGSTAALANNEILVDKTVAKNDHLHVGSTLQMGFASTGIKTYTVGGTYKTNQFLDDYLGSTAIARANSNQPMDEALLVSVAHPGPAAEAALTKSLAAYPQLTVKTGKQFKADQEKMVQGFLRFVYVLLAFSILIALIGVINTLALSVLERTREIGLLRAIGMVRRQVRSMIRGEAVVVSVLGAALGLVLGVGFGTAIVKALSSQGIGTLVVPFTTIIVVLILAGLFGIFAAVFPARRAAKLDVLQAVYTV